MNHLPQHLQHQPGNIAPYEMPATTPLGEHLPGFGAEQIAPGSTEQQLGSVGVQGSIVGMRGPEGNKFQYRTTVTDAEGNASYHDRDLTPRELDDVTVQHAQTRLAAAMRVPRPGTLPAPGTELLAPASSGREAEQSEAASALTHPVANRTVENQQNVVAAPYRAAQEEGPRSLKDIEREMRAANMAIDDTPQSPVRPQPAAPAAQPQSQRASRPAANRPRSQDEDLMDVDLGDVVPFAQSADWTPGEDPGKNVRKRPRRTFYE